MIFMVAPDGRNGKFPSLLSKQRGTSYLGSALVQEPEKQLSPKRHKDFQSLNLNHNHLKVKR